MDKSFWLPFFKKGVRFFFEKKNQKTFTHVVLHRHRVPPARGAGCGDHALATFQNGTASGTLSQPVTFLRWAAGWRHWP